MELLLPVLSAVHSIFIQYECGNFFKAGPIRFYLHRVGAEEGNGRADSSQKKNMHFSKGKLKLIFFFNSSLRCTWERGIRQVKTTLLSVTKHETLNDENLLTVMCEIETPKQQQ